MIAGFLRSCFKKVSRIKERSAFASMFGACQNGNDIIGGRQKYASYVQATADQVMLTSPEGKDFNELMAKLNQRLNGYAENFSSLYAVILSQNILWRASDNRVLRLLQDSFSVQALKEQLRVSTAQLLPKIELEKLNPSERLYLYSVVKNTVDGLQNRRDPKSQECLELVRPVSRRLAQMIVNIDVTSPQAAAVS